MKKIMFVGLCCVMCGYIINGSGLTIDTDLGDSSPLSAQTHLQQEILSLEGRIANGENQEDALLEIQNTLEQLKKRLGFFQNPSS